MAQINDSNEKKTENVTIRLTDSDKLKIEQLKAELYRDSLLRYTTTDIITMSVAAYHLRICQKQELCNTKNLK